MLSSDASLPSFVKLCFLRAIHHTFVKKSRELQRVSAECTPRETTESLTGSSTLCTISDQLVSSAEQQHTYAEGGCGGSTNCHLTNFVCAVHAVGWNFA